MSNLGKWDRHYAAVTAPQSYGNSPTYRMGADALADCSKVEDWGCGLGWFRQFVHPDAYIGVDGSWSRFADVVDDLATRRSSVEGLFMRGILEHNYDWPVVLDNALASFTKRMVLVMFVPWTEVDPHDEVQFEADYGVPTLVINRDRLVEHLDGFDWTETVVSPTETFYGWESVLVIDRPAP